MMKKDSKYTVLRNVFGLESFRMGQDRLIDSILSGRDTLGILPTGGGKSICCQIPALLLPGISLVISPLISLIDDQTEHLKKRGIPSAALTSAVPPPVRSAIYENASRGSLKILYLAPERLSSPEFLHAAAKLTISMICVDEAHCVSKWGRGFRPSYLGIRAFIEALPRRPVVCALTATATPQVRKDIVSLLGLQDPYLLTAGFDRPNLYYGVMHPKDKYETLKLLLLRYPGLSGIIYCDTRHTTESVASKLSADGFPALPYHAGMKVSDRARNQELFLSGRVKIMAATCAFGMGIDKPDVRFVIHYCMPGDVESYYQEAGRAGRDGKPADCILFADRHDIKLKNNFIKGTKDISLRRQMRANLTDMRRFASGKVCLRHFILSYFGENVSGPCGNCSVCRGLSRPRVPEAGDLLQNLTELRLQLAKEKKILPYRIFSNRNLEDMAERQPETMRDLLGIEGISAISAIKYGPDFLAEIRTFRHYSL